MKDIDKIKYKIKKNYIFYLAYKDKKYIEKIYNIIKKNSFLNYNQKGGYNIDNKDINFILKNIDIIIGDLESYNKIILTIQNHDDLMIKINKNYQRFNYDQNILDYLEKIYNNEFIFV